MFLPQFALESGVFYSMQGIRFSSGYADFNHDYINVPILAKYYIFKGLNVFAGPQPGFNVKADAKLKEPEVDGETINRTESYKDYIKTFDPALVIGLGYQFDMGLSVSANYNWGLLNIVKENSYIGSDDDNQHNHVIQVNVGRRF